MTQKITSIVLNTIYNIFCLHGLFKKICEYIRMENLDYKNEYIERKYLENTLDNQFLKAKNSLLEFENDFKELNDRELKDRQEKN